MKAKSFVFSIVFISLFVPIAYFIIIDIFMAQEHHDVSLNYKKFLLDNVSGKRLLIDSGSNSNTGVDPSILEKEFGLSAINLADHAGFPLYYKFLLLINNARDGDVVILPLEWHYYTDEMFDRQFLMSILNGFSSYYYQQMELKDRIYFVYKYVSLKVFMRAIIFRVKNFSHIRNNNSVHKRLKNYQQRLKKYDGNSLGAGLDLAATKDQFPMNMTCDKYIVRFMKNKPIKLGEHFSSLLNMLDMLTSKNVKVIFTWPSVVARNDIPCYSSPLIRQQFVTLTHSIREVITKKGFSIIGEPENSVFPKKYYLDTPYHITKEGAQIRTARLAELLLSTNSIARNDEYQAGDSIKELNMKLQSFLVKYPY